MVCTAPSGILVCIPRGGVSAQEFEEAETSGYVGAIGPFSEVEVAGGMNWKANKLLDVLVHWRWAPALLSEVAQHTHSNLLQRAGCLNSDDMGSIQKRVPAGDTYQLLCIDDYAVLHKVPRGTSPNNRSDCRKDRKLLDQANAAYAKADLQSSAKKAVRDSFNTVVLGGQIDGRRGLVCAPRLRILCFAI